MIIEPKEITEVLRNGGEVYVKEQMGYEPVDLIVFTLEHKGNTLFEGAKSENYLSIDTVLYYPVEEDVLHQMVEFVNTFANADEMNVSDVPGIVWRAWWD